MQVNALATGRFAHHGGRLAVARSLFPDAPQPWVDLSTGINRRSDRAPRATIAARAGDARQRFLQLLHSGAGYKAQRGVEF